MTKERNKKLVLGQVKILLIILLLAAIIFVLGMTVYLNEKIGELEKRLENIEKKESQSPEVSLPPEPTVIPISPERPSEEELEEIEIPLP